MINQTSIGRQGEELVLNQYRKKNYRLVAQNFYVFGSGRGQKGEIDLILTLNNLLVFVEVKTRSTFAFGHPIEQISQTKIKSMKQVIQYFLLKNKIYINYQVRIDVALVLNGAVQIIENAIHIDGY